MIGGEGGLTFRDLSRNTCAIWSEDHPSVGSSYPRGLLVLVENGGALEPILGNHFPPLE